MFHQAFKFYIISAVYNATYLHLLTNSAKDRLEVFKSNNSLHYKFMKISFLR